MNVRFHPVVRLLAWLAQQDGNPSDWVLLASTLDLCIIRIQSVAKKTASFKVQLRYDEDWVLAIHG
ncbi:hypothetical protein [Symmachiella macrocystis]|nr:hypothetical protein [Symmachiella macrocystis]